MVGGVAPTVSGARWPAGRADVLEGAAQVSWVRSGATAASVTASDRCFTIVEGVGVRRSGGFVSADDIDVLDGDDGVDLGQLDEVEGQFVVLAATRERLTFRTDPPLGLARCTRLVSGVVVDRQSR